MIFKRILKYSLCGGLLAGTALAYADGAVTLNGGEGMSISWDAFVTALNNPSTVQGTLDDDHPANQALAAAEKAVEDAKTAKGLAEDTVELVKADLQKAEGLRDQAVADTVAKAQAVTTAQTALDNLLKSEATQAKKKAIEDAEKEYNDSVAAIPVKNNEIASLQIEQSDLQGKLQSAESRKGTLTSELARLESNLANLAREQTSESTPNQWATTLMQYATNFAAVKYGTQSDLVMWYREVVEEAELPWEEDTRTWYLSFKDKPSDNQEWQSASPTAFTDFLLEENPSTGKKQYKSLPDYIYLYLALENGSYEQYKTLKPSKTQSIVTDAKDAIQELKDNVRFQTTTIITGDYKDPSAAAAIQKQIDEYNGTPATETEPAVKGKLELQQELIDGYNDQLNYKPTSADDPKPAGVNVQIARLQAEIYMLNNENSTNPKTLKNLKQAWDDAIVAYDNYLVETQDGVETAKKNLSTSKETLKAKQDAVDAAQADVTAAQAKVTAASDKIAVAEAGVKTAEANVADAQKQADEQEFENYKNITLNEDVVADTQIKSFSGEIVANGHIITVSGNQPLFNTFSGILENAAVNGDLYNRNQNGYLYNVTWWNNNNTTTPGQYYNKSGVSERTYDDLGALGFAVRENFGVNFDKKVLSTLTDETKVYNITLYGEDTNHQKYVQVVDGEFKGVDLPENHVNMFVESATADARTLNLPNLIYNGNKCDYVRITDKVAFYAPKDIEAARVEYTRKFDKGSNAICLPFAVTAAHAEDDINYVCTFDTEREDGTLIFTKVAESIPANTPVLLVAKNSFSFEGDNALENITIKKTESQIMCHEGNEEHRSKSYGVYKTIYPGELRGESDNNRILGYFPSNGAFHNVGATTKITPFRMVVYTDTPLGEGDSKAPRRIAIRDENGVDITDTITGINGVSESNNGLGIAGGQGEIVFTSDSNYGEVAVYSFDGKLVDIVKVLEGTTTVNVAKGLYIVNGKKVMVK